MKRIFSIFFVLIFMLVLVSAQVTTPQDSPNPPKDASGKIGFWESLFSNFFSVVSSSCTVYSGFDYCDKYSNTYGEARAVFEMQTSNLKYDSTNKKYSWKFNTDADDFYYYDKCFSSWNDFWNYANCDEDGCYNYKKELQNDGEIVILQGEGSYSGCPTLVGYEWKKDLESGDWSWATGARGWQPSSSKLELTIAQQCSGADYTFSCTDWSECINGQQTRECTAVCPREDLRPAETRTCTISSCGDGVCSSGESVNICDKDCNECSIGQKECTGGFNSRICVDTVPNLVGGNKWTMDGLRLGECGVECLKDSDCSDDAFIGESFCKDGDSYKKFRDYSCNKPSIILFSVTGSGADYSCQYDETEKLVNECEFGCSNGKCTQENVCTEGEKTCQEDNLLVCQNNDLKVLDSCEFGCSNGKCNDDLGFLEKNIWIILGSIISLIFLLMIIIIWRLFKR